MTLLTVELPIESFERLRALAARAGKPIEILAQEWLVERSTAPRNDLPAPAPPGEREQAIAVLRAAGLLTELSPAMQARAARSSATLADVRAALDRVGGKPLSEVILEMRGPKA